MEAKKKVIRKAYSEFWEAVKNNIDENGHCLMMRGSKRVSPCFMDLGMSRDFVEANIDSGLDSDNNLSWRPKSLQGIEDNNGWTKIESSDDLPKETGYYDFQIFPSDSNLPNLVCWHKNATKVGWFVETYTHYRKFEKPKPPIY